MQTLPTAVMGRAGAPPYQQARARQIGSGTISKSLPRTNITSRRKRPPSFVSEENCKEWTITWRERKNHPLTDTFTHSNCVRSPLPTLSLTDWSCVRSRLPMDVSDFSWQHERHKGHKSGNKWKRVHFPSCSLLWIGNAAVWASFVAFFPSRMRADRFRQNNKAPLRYIMLP